jgi:hypothetical protein
VWRSLEKEADKYPEPIVELFVGKGAGCNLKNSGGPKEAAADGGSSFADLSLRRLDLQPSETAAIINVLNRMNELLLTSR